MAEGMVSGFNNPDKRNAADDNLQAALNSPVPEVAEFAKAIQKQRKDHRFGMAFTVASTAVIIVTTIISMMGLLNYWVPFTLMIVLVFASYAVPISRKPPAPPDFMAIEKLLAQDCDPYRFAKAYSDLMPLFRYAQDQVICKINIALGLFLQGAYDAMESYLGAIDPYTIPEPTLQSFYDLQAHYFIHTGDIAAIQVVESNIVNFSRTHPYDIVKKLCDETLALINAHRLAHAGDAEGAYSQLDERNRSISELGNGTTPYQLVDYHYNRAVIGEVVGNYGAMDSDCMYVIDHGGLLAYVQDASDMLGRH